MRQNIYQPFILADTSTSLNGALIPGTQLFACSMQASVTGTMAGTLKLQFSNDLGASPSVWSDIPSASIAVSNTATYIIAKTDLCYANIRLVYVRTSGTGTITANVNTQGV